jgi:hypothetical protein
MEEKRCELRILPLFEEKLRERADYIAFCLKKHRPESEEIKLSDSGRFSCQYTLPSAVIIVRIPRRRMYAFSASSRKH